ncbi:NUDIX domain-containing protein [Streptomyces sp. NBC_00879]|uniref:NUDIX domain-containing protein n=1 Tax=Streptomyces sp. NBC_00879 TaxID=2975855 RepID=UPI00386786FA
MATRSHRRTPRRRSRPRLPQGVPRPRHRRSDPHRPTGRVLHIKHRALNRWLLPGGHLEPDDTSLLAAAQRELTEETGIPASVVLPAGHRP